MNADAKLATRENVFDRERADGVIDRRAAGAQDHPGFERHAGIGRDGRQHQHASRRGCPHEIQHLPLDGADEPRHPAACDRRPPAPVDRSKSACT